MKIEGIQKQAVSLTKNRLIPKNPFYLVAALPNGLSTGLAKGVHSYSSFG